MSGTDEDEDVLFDAVLEPHRSLSARGFLILMGTLCAISFCAGIAFVMIGAWPVFGFFGLETAIIYYAFRRNYRDAKLYEHLRMTADLLVVERVGPHGLIGRWQFQPHWLRISLPRPVEPATPLLLSSHGRSLAIGGFLPPHERREVADALAAAVGRLRRVEIVPQPFSPSTSAIE